MGLARQFYYALTPTLRFAVRRLYYLPVDCYERVFGKRDPLIPPKGMIFIGSGDFRQQGQHILKLLIDHAGLTPEGKVLDIGCGIGRLASALTGFLSPTGSYDGFDIVKKGIDWCRKQISSRYPNFTFKHIDLKNDLYNVKTDREAKNFSFPYPDESFDCIALTSVFTHMMPEDVDNYLGQIARVLQSGGKCLATFFLINPEIEKKLEVIRNDFTFRHSFEGYRLMDKKVKEANIAYEEPFLFEMLKKRDLRIESVHYGNWSGERADALDFQDILIITKHN